MRITAAEPADVTFAAIAAFYRRIWPDVEERDVDEKAKVAWAFGGNALGRAPLLLAHEGGSLLGVRGGILWSTDLGDGAPRPIVQLHGTAIDQSIRRQGVFSTMTRQFLAELNDDGVPLVYNVSVAASRAGYERLGWTYLDSLRSMFFPVRPDRIMRHLAGRALRRRGTAAPSTELPAFAAVQQLLEARSRSLTGMMHTAYTAEFFEWRFDPAMHRWLGDPVAGYVVYRLRRRGHLTELLLGDVWPGTSSARALVRRAIRHEWPDIVTSWTTTDHPLYRELRLAGFITQRGRALNLGLRCPDGQEPTVTPALMAADVDTF